MMLQVASAENLKCAPRTEVIGSGTVWTLQKFIFGDELLEPALFYAARSRAGEPLGRLPTGGANFQIPPRAEVSFASLLNGFFERHWVEHTKLRRIACAIETSRPATLPIHRAGHDAYPIESRTESRAHAVTTVYIDATAALCQSLKSRMSRHLGKRFDQKSSKGETS